MALVLHVSIALGSLLCTGYLFLRPSQGGLYLSGSLIAGTLASGTWLIISTPGHLMESCLMGLIYLAATITGTAAVRRRLALQPIRQKK